METHDGQSRSVTMKIIAAFVAGGLIGAFSAVEVVPNYQGSNVDVSRSVPASTGGTRAPGSKTLVAGPGSTQPGSQVGRTNGTGGAALSANCAANNGGATDQGVTATSIRMATTVVKSGIGASFLGDVIFAMEAVRNQVNHSGGICGRLLDIKYVDDGWEPQRGAQYLRNFLEEPSDSRKIFAIPVGPSSEGLRVIIDSGDLDKYQIPVVGTDGMLVDQYMRPDGSAQPWVWPIAAATASSARVMVDDAYRRGARHFSVVFDKNYHFGVEAARAFNSEVKRLTHQAIPGFDSSNKSCTKGYCPIVAGQSSYPEVASFEPGDLVALFLEPQTALTWMNDPNTPPAAGNGAPRYGYYGAQPLFTHEFGNDCGRKCDQMLVWTGFKPPIEEYLADSHVQSYTQALQRTNRQADQFNAFSEGGYVGMLLLVEAIKKVGSTLTRTALKQVLDTMILQPGLTIQPTLQYSVGNRFSNITMQAFQLQFKGTFSGWRAGSIVRDPNPLAGAA